MSDQPPSQLHWIAVDDGQDSDHARQLASQLQLPLLSQLAAANVEPQFCLSLTPEGLSLLLTGHRQPGAVRADFTAPAIAYRAHDAVQRQAIARAVGCKPGVRPSVLDATAGLGKDAYLLARVGCQLRLLEKDSVIHAMLADGLQRASLSDDPQVQAAVKAMDLQLGDFLSLVPQLPTADVIYLDPMFPARNKSAQVKRDLFVLQRYFASRQDANDSEGLSDSAALDTALLETALRFARKRVVVKRPRIAPPLAQRQPNYVLSGSSSRYDVYLVDQDH